MHQTGSRGFHQRPATRRRRPNVNRLSGRYNLLCAGRFGVGVQPHFHAASKHLNVAQSLLIDRDAELGAQVDHRGIGRADHEAPGR